MQVADRVAVDQPLRQRGGLDEEEPVVVGRGQGLVDVLVDVQRGHDVEHGQPGDGLGVVERHAVRHARAPVVARPRRTARAPTSA